tara:strand:+ start:511 stop:735 length:225 start_codon:yes stop_codon:yes gene_type:complete
MGYEKEIELEKYVCKIRKLNAYQLIIELDNLEKWIDQLRANRDYDGKTKDAELERQKIFFHLAMVHTKGRIFSN